MILAKRSTTVRKRNKPVKVVNYIVTTQCWNYGKRVTECTTVEEAWDAVGARSFGGLYDVSSPTGLDVYDFVPY